MRFFNSLRNSSFAFVGQIVTILLGFFVRWLFIHHLGQEYLGVNSVMESVLTLLSMTELGVATSVAFALYKPIDDDDQRRIGSIMAFFRKVYHVIGIITAVVGLLLIPFMGFFTKTANNVSNINIIYLIFLTNTVTSYFFSYKRTLLSAYQEHYVNSLTDDFLSVLKYILQCVAIVVFNSYIAYLIIQLVCGFCSNFVISCLCEKKHPLVKTYRNEKLAPEDKTGLKNNIISMMLFRVCGCLVIGTDNLMISAVDIVLMGIYSNYSLIISIIQRVAESVLKSVIGSVGNLMVQDDDDHKYKVFEEFSFVGFACFFFISIVLSACLERFIVIFTGGTNWLLGPLVTFAVVLNFFLHGMRQANLAVIEAAGLFNKLRLKALLEVIVNLVVSFLFLIVFKMGVYGVLFGTTVSKVGVCIWWEAWAVHKYSFSKSARTYTLKFLLNTLVAFIGCFAAYYVSTYVVSFNGFGGLIVSGMVSVLIFAILMFAIYFRSRECKRILLRFKKDEN